jgi:hypothetical protein
MVAAKQVVAGTDPVATRRGEIALEEAPAAFRVLEAGQARGRLVLSTR